ncbi:MAG: hypothetical protein ACLGI6_17425, partial [Gammaproteobacteria bacterium]
MNHTFNTVAEIIAAYQANEVSRSDVARWLEQRRQPSGHLAKPSAIALQPLDSYVGPVESAALPGRPIVALTPLDGGVPAADETPAARAACAIDL